MTASRTANLTSTARRFLPGSFIVALAMLPSSSPYIGDTLSYSASVIRHTIGEKEGNFNALWEFGHLLWRPLGLVVAPVARAIIPDHWATDPRVAIGYGFLGISIIAALITGALMYDMLARYAGWRIAALLVFGLSWANGFLMYALSGSAYITALLCSTAALWVLVADPESPRRRYLAGVLGALAALVWFPHVLTIPALALTPWILKRGSARAGVTAALQVGIAAAIVLMVVYVIGGIAAGVRSVASASEWVGAASHGWEQSQQWKRAVTGVARLMLDLSQDGIVLKRFVLGDPFQSLTFAELVRRSLWKVAAFYVFVAAIIWMCFGTPRGRSALLLSLTATVPLMFFALVLLEPSSPERFLPLVPFILLACAAGWHGVARWVVAAFIVLLPVLNGPYFIEALSPMPGRVTAQVEDLRQHANPRDLVVTVTFADPIAQWFEQRVFHPSLRGGSPPTYQLIAPAEVTSRQWRQRFATRVLAEWTQGANVWIRRGALDSIPDPLLAWVEGDQPHLRWNDVRTFLGELEYDAVTGRSDGFTRLARSEQTYAVLQKAQADTASN